MNLREYNNNICRNSFRKALFKLLLYIFITIPVLIFLIYLFLLFSDILRDEYLSYFVGTLLFIGGLIFLLRIVVDFKFFDRVYDHKNYFLSYCICPHCLNNVNLSTEDNEEWQCNYCGKSFTGNILALCPYCHSEQRLFECPFCEKIIDINSEYDRKKLEELQNERQTDLIQQKNQVKQIADAAE